MIEYDVDIEHIDGREGVPYGRNRGQFHQDMEELVHDVDVLAAKEPWWESCSLRKAKLTRIQNPSSDPILEFLVVKDGYHAKVSVLVEAIYGSEHYSWQPHIVDAIRNTLARGGVIS